MNFTSDQKRNRNVQIGLAEQVVLVANWMMDAPTDQDYNSRGKVLTTVVLAAKEAGVSIEFNQKRCVTEIKAAEKTFDLDFVI